MRGPVALHPLAAEGGREAEHHDGDREDDRDGGLAGAELVDERGLEDAERVDLTDAQVDRECGRWHEPPAEARSGDRVLLVQERQRGHGCYLELSAGGPTGEPAAGVALRLALREALALRDDGVLGVLRGRLAGLEHAEAQAGRAGHERRAGDDGRGAAAPGERAGAERRRATVSAWLAFMS